MNKKPPKPDPRLYAEIPTVGISDSGIIILTLAFILVIIGMIWIMLNAII